MIYSYGDLAGGAWHTRPAREESLWRIWNMDSMPSPWQVGREGCTTPWTEMYSNEVASDPFFRSSLLCRHDILSFIQQRLQFSNLGHQRVISSHGKLWTSKADQNVVRQVAEVMFFTDARWVRGDPNLC